MTKYADLNSPYRIANIRVEPQVNAIVRDAQTIRLEPKVMELLNYLVSKQGQVCGKSEIQAVIWPNQVVADEALTRLIFVLRSALKDDAKSPIFIETIPRKGYLFKVKPSLSGQKNRSWAIGLLGCICLLVMLYLLIRPEAGAINRLVVERTIPVTHVDGREYGYVKHGDNTGYFHQQNGTTKLLLVRADAGLQTLLEDKWQKRSLILLDELVFYIRYHADNYQIVRQTFDGELSVLVDSDTPIYSLTYHEKTSTLLFNHHINNEHIALKQYSFVERQSTSVNFSGFKTPKKVFSPLLTRSNLHLIFIGVESQRPTIYSLDTNTRSLKHHTSGFDEITQIVQGMDEQSVFIAGSKNFSQGIWHLDLGSNQLQLVHRALDIEVRDLFFDAKQDALYLSATNLRSDLSKYTFSGREESLVGLNSTRAESTVRFIEKNQDLYFVSNRTGHNELYVYKDSNTQAKKVIQLTQLTANKIWNYAVSPDGRLAAMVYSDEQIKLGIVDLESGLLQRSITLQEIKFPLGWSADNNYVFISEHLTNIAMYRYEVETLEIHGKQNHLGLSAKEQIDGNIIAFDYQTNRFVSYDFDTKLQRPLSQVVRQPNVLSPRDVLVTNKQVLLFYANGILKQVYQYHLSSDESNHQNRLVAQLSFAGDIEAFSSEQKAMIISKALNVQSDITKLELKRIEKR